MNTLISRSLGATFIVALCVTHVLIEIYDKKVRTHRKAKKEISIALDRHIIRMIMNKQEIMQCNKTTHELSALSELTNQINIFSS